MKFEAGKVKTFLFTSIFWREKTIVKMEENMKEKLFKEILPLVSKPSRYMGNELNIIKKDWNNSKTKIAFAFPDVYEVGMSHVGSKILYGIVNEKTDHVLERVFAPWPDMESLMRENKISLYSLESYKDLKEFDIIAFSLQYELSISNVLNMLDIAGISPLSRERDENYPLIIAGGPVAFNPEPFADFFDAFLIGDGEELLPEFLDSVWDNKELSKENFLLKLVEIEGVYIPSLFEVEYHEDGTIKAMLSKYKEVPPKVKKRIMTNFDQAFFPLKPVLPYMEIVHDRVVLEIMRGCQRACRFCQAGIIYRPVREKSVETLKEQARLQLEATGYEEISLTSLSTLDHSGVEKLLKELVEEHQNKGIGISLPSLRVDAFSIELANEVQKVRKTTLTLAPEAGTQRLRNAINKNVNEEEIFAAIDAAFRSGWNALKLYFMVGLPTENYEDLDGISKLLYQIKQKGKEYSKRPVELRASLSYFVPKAHTPFQWHPQDSLQEMEDKKTYMNSKKMKGIKLSFHDARLSFLEGIIARGDRRVSQVLYLAWKKGAKFDAWSEFFKFSIWEEAIQEAGIETDFYNKRIRSDEEVLPWDFIDIGINKSYLITENKKAKEEITTSDCRQQECVSCGVCPSLEVEMELIGG